MTKHNYFAYVFLFALHSYAKKIREYCPISFGIQFSKFSLSTNSIQCYNKK